MDGGKGDFFADDMGKARQASLWAGGCGRDAAGIGGVFLCGGTDARKNGSAPG